MTVLAIIDSFRRPDYTVVDMERDGFTHVHTVCAGCERIVEMPFRLLRQRGHVQDATTLADIGRGFRCSHCNGRMIAKGLPQPSYQYMGTGADTGNTPVNRRLPESRWFLPGKPHL